MGNFYTSVTVANGDHGSVEALMEGPAFLAAGGDGFTVVLDKACEAQDEAQLADLAGRLSQDLQCMAFAVLVHDDSILMYFLYENGESRDSYHSKPGYFSGDDLPPSGGDADVLARMFGAEASAVEHILRQSFVFEHERHQALIAALGLPERSFAIGYNYCRTEGDPAVYRPVRGAEFEAG